MSWKAVEDYYAAVEENDRQGVLLQNSDHASCSSSLNFASGSRVLNYGPVEGFWAKSEFLGS